jgi:hypothetical protein
MNGKTVSYAAVIGALALVIMLAVFLVNTGAEANGGDGRRQTNNKTEAKALAGRRNAVAPRQTKAQRQQSSKHRVSTEEAVSPVMGSQPPGPISILTDNGNLPSGVKGQFGLTETQLSAAQAEVSALWAEVQQSIARRAVYDSRGSDPENKIVVYRIPAEEDRGRQLLETFRNNIERIAGAPLASALDASFQPQLFGGSGKYDVMLQFAPDQELIDTGRASDSTRVKFVYTNADTGATVLCGESNWEVFHLRVGSLPLRG